MKHIPTPWKLGEFRPFGMYLADNSTTDVIGSIFGGYDIDSRGPTSVVSSMVDRYDMANARLIVKCVNSHDKMVNLLKEWLKAAEPKTVEEQERFSRTLNFLKEINGEK